MGVSVVTLVAENLILPSAALLLTPRLDLFTAVSPAINPASAWADFTIATFTGYSGPVTVVPTATYVSNETQLLSFDIPSVAFNGPTSGAGVDVLGWVLHDTTATPLVYAAGMFDGPLSLQLITDRVTVLETINMVLAALFEVAN